MAELPDTCPVTRASTCTLQDAEQEDTGDTALSWVPVHVAAVGP